MDLLGPTTPVGTLGEPAIGGLAGDAALLGSEGTPNTVEGCALAHGAMAMTGKKQKQSDPAHAKSWLPGHKGQGGEGLSEGYGGSAGDGTGASGPEQHSKKRNERRSDDIADAAHRDRDYSPSLPSREKIAKSFAN